MPSTIHAELTAGGDQIVLIAAGPLEDVAHAAKQLQQATPLFKASNPPGALLCRTSWPAVVQLGAIYGDGFRPGPALQGWIGNQVARRMAAQMLPASPDGLQLIDHGLLPEGLTPRPYQVAGAGMIAATGRALIFDEPRTGKTITTILGLVERFGGPYRTGGMPILVVCPASVVDPWVEEFRRWAPYWTTVAWRGAPARRRALLGQADVYVVSYDTARADAGDTNPRKSPLIALSPRALVADECHLIKSPKAARTRAVQRLARNVQAFVALSGTPISHHPADLWPTLSCLEPAAWPARERWVNRYCTTGVADYGESILGLHPGTEPEFRLTLLGQQRRVARADVLDQLPPKVYSVRTVELPPEYRKAYDAMEHTMLAELPDGQEMSVMDVLAQINCLSALACAAADVEITIERDEETGEEKRHQHIELKAPSWKVDALLEILEERPGDPVAAFAPSAQLMRLAGQAAAAAGKRVGYIIGGQSQAERTRNRLAFQDGQLDLVCCTTGAGGVGITLSRAGTLVFLQRPWSLIESIQAEDRGEGAPAERGTEIIDIVAANTVDTRRRSVLRERAGQLADLVKDPRIVAELLGGASITQLRKVS